MGYERNVKGSKRGFGYNPETRSLGIYVDGQLCASFPPTPGRTYFVNNITGSATNDGLSWETAMDEVSTAITASDTYRELGGLTGSGRSVATNDYVRNTIMVQGTGTAYTYLTDLGEHLNLIGLASPTGGQGAGTSYGGVRFGADGATNTTGGYVAPETNAARSYGVYLANLKFQSGHTAVCWQTHKFEESVMEDCAFYEANAATGVPAAYIDIITAADSSIFRRLHTGTHAGFTDRATAGFTLSGAYFINCIVEDCCIGGTAYGWYAPVGVTHGYGSVVRYNLFGDMGQGTMAVGIHDASTKTSDSGGLITYIHNYCQATDPMAVTTEWSRCIMNYGDNAVLTS